MLGFNGCQGFGIKSPNSTPDVVYCDLYCFDPPCTGWCTFDLVEAGRPGSGYVDYRVTSNAGNPSKGQLVLLGDSGTWGAPYSIHTEEEVTFVTTDGTADGSWTYNDWDGEDLTEVETYVFP